MSARILTSEQIDALAALGVTRWYAHRRAWGDGSPVGTLHVRGDSLARQEACAELLAAAPDLLATVKDIRQQRDEIASESRKTIDLLSDRLTASQAEVERLREERDRAVGLLQDRARRT